jgi:LysM repeat protein
LGQRIYRARDDTLASIASNFGIAVEELKRANGLSSDGLIHVGQKLLIPGQQTDIPYIGRRFEKQRGILVFTIYRQPDGISRDEFVFIMKNEDGSTFHAVLENVSGLSVVYNPARIWGT